jgi:UDP-glucose 4-epimerase
MTGRRVLVVGGAGYVGAHVARALVDAGHVPVVLDDLSSGHADLVADVPLVRGRCGDAALLDRVLGGARFDAVMHFAARSLVGDSMRRPLVYWRNNVGETAVLLERMLAHGVEQFVFSSSAAVYGAPARTPIREDAALAPISPYGRSKAAVEAMLADAATAHGLRAVSLRYFNAAGAHPTGDIGERHEPETHLIPSALRVALGTQSSLPVFGNDYPTPDGTSIRDYVHVCDLASAHVLALDALGDGYRGGAFNLGASRGHSVLEVVAATRDATGRAIPLAPAPRRPGDPAVLVADSSRARAELGWRPAFESLDAIVASAWRWHRREHARVGGV